MVSGMLSRGSCPLAMRRAPIKLGVYTSRRHLSQGVSYYDVLSIGRNATTKEIKAKFYELSRKYHPDVSPDSAKRFTEINAAYAVLKQETSRRDYDRSLPHERRAPSSSSQGGYRTASGLSRRKTRPVGTPPSSPFRASPYPPRSNQPAGFGFGSDPSAEGEVRNQHFSFDEHRFRHSNFDVRYTSRLQEELSKRNTQLRDNFLARFLGISGLIVVVILFTGGMSRISAEVRESPRPAEKHEVAWTEAMKTRNHAYEHRFWKPR